MHAATPHFERLGSIDVDLATGPPELTAFKNLSRWALQHAMAEVNDLSDFGVRG